jgi:predicted glutamine amidotransferase
MCRLFALHADAPVTARFWLLDAPYSLAEQSKFNADGTGIGWFGDDGTPQVRKRPVAAYSSPRYARVASELRSRVMIAHVRNSSGTSNQLRNTHPFLARGVMFAHNGVVRVNDEMRERVAALGTTDVIEGETDSEWLFALVLGEAARAVADGVVSDGAGADGAEVEAIDPEALERGLVAAISWVLANVPVYSLNVVVACGEHLFALRLPETNELWVRDRPAGGRRGDGLHQSSDTLTAESEDLRRIRSVVVASEPMDDSDQWRLLDSGELLHVSPGGRVVSTSPFCAPAFPLGIEDLGLSEASSQAHAAEVAARAARRGEKAAEQIGRPANV